MNATSRFAVGVLTTLAVGIGIVWYLHQPLRNILIELCGHAERAECWTSFAAVAMGVVPVIFAMGCRPAPGPEAPAVFELVEQLKWGLIGLISTVLVLGWVVGRSIVRWEARAARTAK